MSESIGQFLRKRRESLSIKQNELADAIGVSSAYINRIEKGQSKPAAGFLEKVSKILELDTLDLYLKSLETRNIPESLVEELQNLKQFKSLLEPDKPLARFQNITRHLSEEDVNTILIIVESIALMIANSSHRLKLEYK